MSINEIYNKRNLECQKTLEKYDKDILDCKDDSDISLFNKIWIIDNRFLFILLINKPKGLPYIQRSYSSSQYPFMEKFYSQYERLNSDTVSDDELEQILHP
jgi:hypothetical protein